MNNLINIKVEDFGKRHKHILDTIRELEGGWPKSRLTYFISQVTLN